MSLVNLYSIQSLLGRTEAMQREIASQLAKLADEVQEKRESVCLDGNSHRWGVPIHAGVTITGTCSACGMQRSKPAKRPFEHPICNCTISYDSHGRTWCNIIPTGSECISSSPVASKVGDIRVAYGMACRVVEVGECPTHYPDGRPIPGAILKPVPREEPVQAEKKSDPTPGTFMWAVEQMQQGKMVTRPGRGGFLPNEHGMFPYVARGIPSFFPFHISDFTATDWEIADVKGDG